MLFVEPDDCPAGFYGTSAWAAVEIALELFGERNSRGGTKGNKPGPAKGVPKTILTEADKEARRVRRRQTALRSYHKLKASKPCRSHNKRKTASLRLGVS